MKKVGQLAEKTKKVFMLFNLILASKQTNKTKKITFKQNIFEINRLHICAESKPLLAIHCNITQLVDGTKYNIHDLKSSS